MFPAETISSASVNKSTRLSVRIRLECHPSRTDPVLTLLLPIRFVSVTTWRSSSPAVARRRRTGGAPGRSWPGTAAGSCDAVRRWSRASPTVCSHSTAAWWPAASLSSTSRTTEDGPSPPECPPEDMRTDCTETAGRTVD